MNKFILLLLLLSNLGCNGQEKRSLSELSITHNTKENTLYEKNTPTNLQRLKLSKDSISSYESVKKSIKKHKLKWLQKKYKSDTLSILFKKALIHRIIPFWEGTTWSFEGHTAIPKKGNIACGYFVSTTLKHVGLNLNRYKLAQQSPINEALSLALNTSVTEISETSNNENIAKINTVLKEGIHFIGFDQSHVGFILKENGKLYLIHSNYIDSKGVMIEKIEESSVFSTYDKFYIVEISTNKKLLKDWIEGNEIKVISTN